LNNSAVRDDRDNRFGSVRPALAACAVVLGLLICLHKRHFTVDPWHPSSFLVMTHHRCGLAMLAASLWAILETGYGLYRRFTVPPPTLKSSAI